MAEAVVGSLLLKIGSALAVVPIKSTCSLLTSEAWAIKSFFDEMKNIQEELLSIQGFLQEAERFNEKAANIKNFIREIRRVAFDIEDIIDEFTYKLDEQKRGVVVKSIKKVVHIKTWYKLLRIIKKIKAQLQDIKKRKTEYDPGGIVKRAETHGGRWRTAEDEHFVREGDLVGIDEYKKKLVEMLSYDRGKHNVISVWGMGGVGKTTLVTHVYNTVKRTFDACAWITVSRTWERDQLLRKILQEFHREDPNRIIIDGIETMDFRNLGEKMQNYLQNKRYLVILDDVWSANVWHCITDKLPQANSARIILTTRNQEVALLAPNQQIMKVIPLDGHHSWNLFCKTAFKKNDTNTCPEELVPWAGKIIEKCCGLPLALLAIGGLMACKEQTEREWKRMWEDLEHELAHNSDIEDVNRIFQLSFLDLSSNLKNCLLYWSTYPEDCEVRAADLIDRWIAEGFVEMIQKRKQEEVAENYQNELVNRCLLQVVERDIHGKVETCRMHDIIHSMVISKSKEEEFCMVLGSSTSLPGDRLRRVSIQNCNLERARTNDSSLRSLLIFNSEISHLTLCIMLSSSKFLRVLDLDGISMEKVPKEVFNLFNLHYLGLNNTGIRELSKSIGRLQNLQFLLAGGTNIVKLPNELTKLRALRVLLVTDENFISGDGHIFKGVMPPKQIWRLKDLRVLRFIKATDEVVQNLGTFFELTQLSISEIRSEQCEGLFTSISNMSHLERLTLAAKDGEILKLEAFSTSALDIIISGQIERTSVPAFSRSLQRFNSVRTLVLLQTRLDANSFSCLQEMHSLTALRLCFAYDGNDMCFHGTSFRMLREFGLVMAPHLKCIEINEGAMTNLERLFIIDCTGPEDLPQGIEYLTKLQIFEWENPNRTLVERIQRERAERQLSADRRRILSVVRTSGFIFLEEIHAPSNRIY
jgi:disease resistance protein RPM1